jgi:hypothetical protein
MLPVQKKNNCWWFGETGKCYNFYILMAFVGVCTGSDIACHMMLALSTDAEADTTGSTSGSMSENTSGGVWKHRYVV